MTLSGIHRAPIPEQGVASHTITWNIVIHYWEFMNLVISPALSYSRGKGCENVGLDVMKKSHHRSWSVRQDGSPHERVGKPVPDTYPFHAPLTSISFLVRGLPLPANLDLCKVEPRALVVGGVEQEHTREDGGGFVEAVEAPEAEAVAMQAAEVRSVVD